MKSLYIVTTMMLFYCSVFAQKGSIPVEKFQKLMMKAVGEKFEALFGTYEKITKQQISETTYTYYSTGNGKYGFNWVQESTNIPWSNGFMHNLAKVPGNNKLTLCVFKFKNEMNYKIYELGKPDDDESTRNSLEFYILTKDTDEFESLIKQAALTQAQSIEGTWIVEKIKFPGTFIYFDNSAKDKQNYIDMWIKTILRSTNKDTVNAAMENLELIYEYSKKLYGFDIEVSVNADGEKIPTGSIRFTDVSNLPSEQYSGKLKEQFLGYKINYDEPTGNNIMTFGSGGAFHEIEKVKLISNNNKLVLEALRNPDGQLQDLIFYYVRKAISSDQIKGREDDYEKAGIYYSNGDFIKAYEYYISAAIMGYPKAMIKASNLFYRGKGTQVNYNSSMTWLFKAANIGSSDAMNELSEVYRIGTRGETVNKQKAAEWKQRAETAKSKEQNN